jgi:hypothetical protein
MQKHVATYRRLHDLSANKPSDKKGGGDGTFDNTGEILGVHNKGMAY